MAVAEAPKINRKAAKKVLATVDQGLCRGLGVQKPGQMCVEAAICFALDLPHGDDPECVDSAVRSFKISLNDSFGWSSNAARAKGMRRAALAQLGSKGKIDSVKFARIVAEQTIRQIVPIALLAAASVHPQKAHRQSMRDAAKRCRKDGDWAAAAAAAAAARAAAAAAAARAADAAAADDAARAAAAAARAADAAADAARAADAAADARAADAAAAARDYILSLSAEICVQALIECKSPGAKFLDLAPLKLKKPAAIRAYELAKD